MAAYDVAAVLASAITVTGTGAGTEVSTATGAAMAGVPGARGHQALIWFTGAITATQMIITIDEEIDGSGVWRPIGIAQFGTTPVASGTWDNDQDDWAENPMADYASLGEDGPYTHLVFCASFNATKLRYNVIQYAGGGSAVGMNIVVVPFEGSGPLVGWIA